MKIAGFFTRAFGLLFQASFLLVSCKSNVTGVISEETDIRMLDSSLQERLKSYDTAQKRSASFLLQNIGKHSFMHGEKEETYANMIEQYSRAGDTLEKILQDLKGMQFPDSRKIYDKDFLSAGYVANDILLTHNTFNKTYWKKQVSAENFYNYVLPYRIYKESLDKASWRQYYLDNYRKVKGDSIFSMTLDSAIVTLHHWLREKKKHFKLKFGSDGFNLPSLPVTANNDLPLGTCDELASLSTAQLRALGIPATIDFAPNYANVNSGHSWAAAIITDTSCMPFDISNDTLGKFKDASFILTKVYRQSFRLDKSNAFYGMPVNKNLPECFANPFLKDITSLYTTTSDLTIPLMAGANTGKETTAYICVFSRPEWTPVDRGEIKDGKIFFNQVGRRGIYLPLIINPDNTRKAISNAFQLMADGTIHYFIPDTMHRQEAVLYRKYPTALGRDNDLYIKRVMGGSFQGANRSDFKDSVTLYTIDHHPSDTFNVITIRSSKNFRYVRYLSAQKSYGNIAEVEFYSGTRSDSLLKGVVIGTTGSYMDKPRLARNALFDGDLLTYFDSKQADYSWAGLQLAKPATIGRIRFMARNDLNGIVKGDTYELFYWNNEWTSLGRVIAENNYLTYKNVPQNAVLWLRNLSAGKEERIFTYQNGKQVWW